VKKWRYLSFDTFDAFENMAIDEAIFHVCQRQEGCPILRFYGWERPSVSVGYFQNVVREINVEFCRQSDIPFVRRPTGGKAVLHENDLTYAVVARQTHPLFCGGLLRTYQAVSECIAAGLAHIGIAADMFEEGRSAEAAGYEAMCFSAPSQYELLVDEKKICGSAQVRSKGAFLQHGSLLLDFDPLRTCRVLGTREEEPEAEASALNDTVTSVREFVQGHIGRGKLSSLLAAGFEEHLGVRLVEGRLTPEEETVKKKLLERKYRTNRWNIEGKALEWISDE